MGTDLAQLLQGERDLVLLALELGDARPPLGERGAQLLQMIGVDVVEIEQLLDVGQREAQTLAAQDELEPRPVARAVDAIAADALRRQQALILIEADRARRKRRARARDRRSSRATLSARPPSLAPTWRA